MEAEGLPQEESQPAVVAALEVPAVEATVVPAESPAPPQEVAPPVEAAPAPVEPQAAPVVEAVEVAPVAEPMAEPMEAAAVEAAPLPAEAEAPSTARLRVRSEEAGGHLTSRSQLSVGAVNGSQPSMVVTSNHPRSPKWSLRGRIWEKAAERHLRRKMPGPGDYDISGYGGKFAAASKLVFARTPRFETESPRKIRAPGVGAYEPKFALLEPQPLRVPFGSSQRPGIVARSSASLEVGPGSYAIPSKLSETPGVSMKGRNWVKPSKSTVIKVGPGEYKLPPIRSTTGRLFSFSRSPRSPSWAQRFTAPAVGTYNLQNWKSLGTEAPKIALSGRPKNWNQPGRVGGSNPGTALGPGAYNAATTSFGY